jgi:transcriptional regulator of acetoin/glycerol metabolism
VLLAYDWPGNVRQLENALEYATAICDGQTIHVEDLPPELHSPEPELPPSLLPQAQPSSATSQDIDDGTPLAARRHPVAEDVLGALRSTRYRRADAAKLLGVSRTTLWRRMRELGIG